MLFVEPSLISSLADFTYSDLGDGVCSNFNFDTDLAFFILSVSCYRFQRFLSYRKLALLDDKSATLLFNWAFRLLISFSAWARR